MYCVLNDDHRELYWGHMKSAIEAMLSGTLPDEDVAKFIVDLRDKGETADDIAECVAQISQRALPIRCDMPLLDVCGTGGSGLDRFNVSTASAFVLSALGVPVLKHGNRGSHRPNGSFDLLEKLGIAVEQTPEQVQLSLAEANLGFVYAKHYHPCLKFVAKGRALAGGRSIFNLAGPLSNPAPITYQVMGTPDTTRARILLDACIRLGRERVAIVVGEPGIDEVSASGATEIYQYCNGKFEHYRIAPEEFGIKRVSYSDIPSGEAEANARVFMRLLDGNCSPHVLSMVALNSGLAAYISGRAESIGDGYEMSVDCITSGRMRAQFERYRSLCTAKGHR